MIHRLPKVSMDILENLMGPEFICTSSRACRHSVSIQAFYQPKDIKIKQPHTIFKSFFFFFFNIAVPFMKLPLNAEHPQV